MICQNCGFEHSDGSKICSYCGAAIEPDSFMFLMSTTPTIQGYKIKKVIGVVTGLTPRTRGFLGKIIGGVESLFGGEVKAFTIELERARNEAIDRVKNKAAMIGANAIVGLDVETSDIGSKQGITVISATGTAVVVEPEEE